jgi:hypothetical protein
VLTTDFASPPEAANGWKDFRNAGGRGKRQDDTRRVNAARSMPPTGYCKPHPLSPCDPKPPMHGTNTCRMVGACTDCLMPVKLAEAGFRVGTFTACSDAVPEPPASFPSGQIRAPLVPKRVWSWRCHDPVAASLPFGRSQPPLLFLAAGLQYLALCFSSHLNPSHSPTTLIGRLKRFFLPIFCILFLTFPVKSSNYRCQRA